MKKLKKQFYLKNIKHLVATRGSMSIKYSKTYNEENQLKKLDFLIDKVKKGFPTIKSQLKNIGISKAKKMALSRNFAL